MYTCSTTFDTPEWKACISQPSLPYVLKMLRGLCRWHSKTQLAMVPVISELHLLEQVASDQHIGTMAENLLEAMMENPTCQAEVIVCVCVCVCVWVWVWVGGCGCVCVCVCVWVWVCVSGCVCVWTWVGGW